MMIDAEKVIERINASIRDEIAEYGIATPFAKGLAYARYLVRDEACAKEETV